MAALIGQVISIGFLFCIYSFCSTLVQPICELALELALTPLSVPIVNQIILWSQLCALILVVFIRVGKGIYENVFQKAANEETGSAVQWLFKSLIAVACVAVMPLLCNIIIEFGCKAFSDLTGATSSVISNGNIHLQFVFPEEGFWTTLENSIMATLAIYMGCGVIVIAEVIFICMNVYQIVKRQIVMLVVSIAATWVSIKSATDNTDDVIDVLVSLLGLVLIQVIQWVFLVIALAQISTLDGGGVLFGADLTDKQTLYSIIFSLALMGAALGVPQILERYAFSTGRSGAGNMIVGAAMRTGIAAPRSIGSTTSSVLTRTVSKGANK